MGIKLTFHLHFCFSSSQSETHQQRCTKRFPNFSLRLSLPLFLLSIFTLPQSPQTTPSGFFCPGPFLPKSTLTQLKIHFVWPKSEGVCAMGLLHTALKLVLWRRMGYYYLPATHPAIKTSGATSPQRRAAALPPFFLSLSRSSYMSHTQQWACLTLNSTPATRLHRQTQESLSALLCCAALLPFIGYFSFLGCFFFFVNGYLNLVWGACEWTDWQTGKERGSCVSIKESYAERSSEEQRSFLVVWKYKDTWEELRKRRYGRWCLLKSVECWGNVSRHVQIYLDVRLVEHPHGCVCVCNHFWVLQRMCVCVFVCAPVWISLHFWVVCIT